MRALVVATLGGTGTGKSTLVNALVGAEVSSCRARAPHDATADARLPAGAAAGNAGHRSRGGDGHRARCAGVARPGAVGLSRSGHDRRRSCCRGTNLARLRELLPHCDVLLVATTQQKYRSARVTRRIGRRRGRGPAGLRADACRRRCRCARGLAAGARRRLFDRRDVLRRLVIGHRRGATGHQAARRIRPPRRLADARADRRRDASHPPGEFSGPGRRVASDMPAARGRQHDANRATGSRDPRAARATGGAAHRAPARRAAGQPAQLGKPLGRRGDVAVGF